MRIVILLVFLFLLACASQQSSVEISGNTIFVELPQTQEDFQKGLMFRESLSEDQGMLFIFPQDREWSFWMKNTLIPLDMIFIDEQGGITKIHHAVPCKEEPCELYTANAKYVLEVNAGYAKRHGIAERDKAVFSLT
ncbi:DUF192 domain-containing protein [Candidatus Woesearchaeota archaeon]|nr:DUF192 domain-containing protein [Candidatus Woesearchaeota archaeon]